MLQSSGAACRPHRPHPLILGETCPEALAVARGKHRQGRYEHLHEVRLPETSRRRVQKPTGGDQGWHPRELHQAVILPRGTLTRGWLANHGHANLLVQKLADPEKPLEVLRTVDGWLGWGWRKLGISQRWYKAAKSLAEKARR